jgi:ribosomal protein S18 acetylase RimI-like enzyme
MGTTVGTLPGGIRMESLSDEEFRPLFQEWRPRIFTDEAELNPGLLLSDEEKEARTRLAGRLGPRWGLNLVLRDGDALVGWSAGFQLDAERYYMMNSAIVPEYRGRGLYKAMLPPILELLRTEGFQVVTSRHLATNNRVLVPKLRAGFLITGFEIHEAFGILVNLSWFASPLRREAVLWRAGAVRPGERLRGIIGE